MLGAKEINNPFSTKHGDLYLNLKKRPCQLDSPVLDQRSVNQITDSIVIIQHRSAEGIMIQNTHESIPGA